VFVVDDDKSYLASVKRLLRAAGYSVRCYSSAREFLDKLPLEVRGCVVADLKMPGMDGLELQEELVRAGNPLPVIFLTGHGDIPTTVRAMRNGAHDFLIKTTPSEVLLAAIEGALERDAAESRQRARQLELRTSFEELSPRELEVLLQVLRGRLNKQIGEDLGITERSVKRHRTNYSRKLGVKSVAEISRLAVEAGVVNEREQ
jgi:FixJ family two-component response regulator